MNYEESNKIIYMLANLVWPLNYNDTVCFNFISEVDFEILYQKNKPPIEDGLMLAVAREKGFPYAQVSYNKHDHIIFFYVDNDIMLYEINFTTGEIIHEFSEPIRFCPLRSRQGMRALFEMFERMKLPEND